MQKKTLRILLALSLMVVVIAVASAVLMTGRGGRRLSALISRPSPATTSNSSETPQNKFRMIEDDVTDDEGWWKFQL